MRPEDVVEISISVRVGDKIWSKHAVAEEEIYEVFENPDDQVKIRISDVAAGSYIAYGRTLAGRYLMVALWPKGAGKVNIATARDMTDAERDLYKRK